MGIKGYIYGAIALIMIGMALTITLLYKDNQAKATKIAELNVALQLASETKKMLEEKLEENQQTIMQLQVNSRIINIQYQDAVSELERAKKKKEAVIGRPTLVEKMANRATKKVFSDIECVSGGRCEE